MWYRRPRLVISYARTRARLLSKRYGVLPKQPFTPSEKYVCSVQQHVPGVKKEDIIRSVLESFSDIFQMNLQRETDPVDKLDSICMKNPLPVDIRKNIVVLK